VIRQFDVFENPSPRSRPVAPYVAVLSSHHIDGLATVLVAPMVRAVPGEHFTRVSAAVSFRGEDLMLSLPELAPIPRKALGPGLGALGGYEDQIRRALERLFTGF